MKAKTNLISTLLIFLYLFPFQFSNAQFEKTHNIDLYGQWIRVGPAGPIALNFRENGIVEVDFNHDQEIDAIATYTVANDTVLFDDKEIQSCEKTGTYKIFQTDYYLALDVIDDLCGGRVKTTMGFWVRNNHKELLEGLNAKIARTDDPELRLNRARMYMALGRPDMAKVDFDFYLSKDPSDARVFINRAATRFPINIQGVVSDCTEALRLDPGNKNAYFLRGLALYELNEKEKACDDFSRAIQLGFSVLRQAEYEKCAAFWKSKAP